MIQDLAQGLMTRKVASTEKFYVLNTYASLVAITSFSLAVISSDIWHMCLGILLSLVYLLCMAN